MTEVILKRYRICFQKGDHVRYISHLDLHRAIERTLIRSKLPVNYSKGFSPRIRLNLTTALPLGCSSLVELADIWLLEDLDPSDIHDALASSAPPGITFTSVEPIDMRMPSLQSQIRAVEYRVELTMGHDPTTLAQTIEDLLANDSLPRTRRGKQYDLRPLIHELEGNQDQGDQISLRMLLNVGEGSTGRPEEVLFALGLDPSNTFIERTRILLTETPIN